MYIVHIASELAPVAKVGGLGDVIHGLSKQQQKNGDQVEIIIPKYDILQYQFIKNLSLETPDLWSFEDAFKYHNAVWSGIVDGLKTYFIEPHHNQYYFNRGAIYGCLNDIERFLYFCRTTLEFLFTSEKKPDIIHVHDWPTASIPILLKTIYEDLGFKYGASVLTIHNLEHQGRCHPRSLTRIGLRGEDYRTPSQLQDPCEPTLLNLLQGGIVYADQVSTVSKKYSQEIKTPEFGFKLDPIIHKHQHKINGILNGIEINTWNPAKDSSLAENYPSNPTYIEEILKRKKDNQVALCKKLNIKKLKRPLLTCITRIAKQKSPQLIQRALHYALENDGSFILIGSTHEKQIEKEFKHLQKVHESNPNIHIELEFNNDLAHLVFAAADAILVPSLYEPCGLTQMIAMRYGTVPIARMTGGLADTVFDLDDLNIPTHQRTGFLFRLPTENHLNLVLERAFNCYRNEKKRWSTLMQNGLSVDFSWKKSAHQYQLLYKTAIKSRKKSKSIAI